MGNLVTPERPNSSVAPQITVIVLTAGVVGGLFIVVTVFIICKYCVKRKKSPRSPSLDQLPPVSPNRLLTMESKHKDHERCLDEQEPTETTRLKSSIQQINESPSCLLLELPSSLPKYHLTDYLKLFLFITAVSSYIIQGPSCLLLELPSSLPKYHLTDYKTLLIHYCCFFYTSFKVLLAFFLFITAPFLVTQISSY
ncbi:unnamed protein product [Acanthosepion pharaonis]|uniref:Uncharacterized protein n=1 Tax=Acanthosepion pharaonis TaxID=158019 RepID=A0A812C496_ACAPH|nr:unnamed protein product [Sepia pharaonis]